MEHVKELIMTKLINTAVIVKNIKARKLPTNDPQTVRKNFFSIVLTILYLIV